MLFETLRLLIFCYRISKIAYFLQLMHFFGIILTPRKLFDPPFILGPRRSLQAPRLFGSREYSSLVKVRKSESIHSLGFGRQR